MKEQYLTESAAIVKIVEQFFDGFPETKVLESAKDDAIASLKADIAELKQRLMVLEQAVIRHASSRIARSPDLCKNYFL